MECTKIKELLSEYIDQTLTPETNEMVKQHLLVCKICSEELSALQNCIRNISSLKQVQAPENFLQKVHERIERRFEFERIMRKLFIPPKVKIPLEFAGVLATVVLIIMIYRAIQPLEQMSVLPVIVEPQEMLDKTKQKPSVMSEEKISFGIQKGSYMSYGLADGLNISRGVTPHAGIESTKSLLQGLPTNAALEQRFELGTQSLSGYINRYSIANAFEYPYPLYREEEYNKEFSKIKGIIESLKGTIVFINFNKETKLLESIIAKIPAQNYSIFLERLKEINISDDSLISVIVKDEESALVNIRLIPSK